MLNSSTTGSALYSYIKHALNGLDSQQQKIERAYSGLIDLLLSDYESKSPPGSAQRINTKILRLGLTPSHSLSELHTLQRQLKNLIADKTQTEDSSKSGLSQPFERPLDNLSLDSSPPTHDSTATLKQSNKERQTAPLHPLQAPYRQNLDETRNSIHSIRERLGEQVTQTLDVNNEFIALVMDCMDAMQRIDNNEELEAARESYLRQCTTILDSHKTLTSRIDTIHSNLHTIESNSQHLDDELERVHMLGFTDELTALPNRRALIQRIEDEVARAQRYGTPLTLTILDLDEFKAINDQYGHLTGDEVLKIFSTNILNTFRHHDVVSRYGGEEFAVLLPNTDIEGAFCSLEKVQKHIAGIKYSVEEEAEIALPTFSVGIALYNTGESPDELIKRADTAMYRAKRMGGNRIEIHTLGTHNTKTVN